MVLIRFPSVSQAEAFYHSPQYQKLLQISKKSAERTVVILKGI